MRIRDIKINGVENPVGFDLGTPVLSFKVDDTESTEARNVKIVVGNQILKLEGKDLKQKGVPLDIPLKPRTRYDVYVEVIGNQGDVACGTGYFETGKMQEPWGAEWISPRQINRGEQVSEQSAENQESMETPHPILTRTINMKKPVKSARLYATGVGVFEAYMNGEKLGEEYLAPFQSHYETYIQTLTFPVENLVEGENQWEFLLGKGWYMGTFGLEGQKCNYGNRMAAIGELRVTYEDGEEECFLTGEEFTWRPSHILDSGIYFGEIQENKTDITSYDVEVLRHPESEDGTKNLVKTHLRDRISPRLTAHEIFEIQEIIQTSKGETVLDMGQNFAGIIRFHANFPKGTKVEFDFGEILQEGNFYRDNYREAESKFVYISSGEREVVEPHFTYFGFRYIRVTGWPGELKIGDVQGVALYSEMEETGKLHTGNAKVDRLISNTMWGLKSNFMDLPTDCPQRNERLGWTGDAQVFSPTACYHMDTRAFYRKFTTDLRKEQEMLDGAVPNYIPNIGHKKDAGSVWGDVATFLPNVVYEMFGDKAELRRNYPLMKDWVDWITAQDEARGAKHLFDFGFHFGDWLALDGPSESSFKGSTEDAYVGSMYYARSAQIVAETAEKLGNAADAAKYQDLYEKIVAAIKAEYFTANGRLAADTQASYILALKFDIYVNRQRVLEQFKQKLKKDGYQIRCGFVGAPLICTVLAECGEVKLAYDLLLREAFPSWLYCVNLGATTVWERWNSVMPDGSISKTGMNSLNHYSYGSVMEFVYAYGAGIRPLTPGFERVTIAPHPDPRLPKLECSYDSVSGRYVCNTELEKGGMVKVYIEVPFACEAEVTLPYTQEQKTLKTGTYNFIYQPEQNPFAIYGAHSRLDELAGEEKALDILFRHLPAYGGMAKNHHPEFQYETLEEMRARTFIPCDPIEYEAAIAELQNLIVE